jgi:hypothetical protein
MRGLFVPMLVLIGCSSKGESRREPRPDMPIDAGVHQLALGTPIAPVGHVDEPAGDTARWPGPGPNANRQIRAIDVVLRSTPTGAQAAVDGLVIGPTPAYWNGNADGREHEFTFVLPGHAIARYRFVPITSGTIHARLVPISDDVDAGVPPPEVVPPRPWEAPQPDAPRVAPDANQPNPYGPLP